MTVGERFDRTLREVTQPLIAQFNELKLEIEVREAELAELRAARLRLTTIIRQIDPALAPKKEQPKAAPTVSQATVEAVFAWVKENLNGDEFHASGLLRREDFDVTSQSQVAKSLVVLHEQGRIRLVRQGSGGAKFYKVVA